MFKYLCLCPSSFAKWVQLTVCIQLWLKCEKSLINRAAQDVFKVCCCVGYVDAFCLFLQNNQRMLPKVIDWLLIDFLSASECSNIGLMSELGQVFLRSMWRILCLPNRKISQMQKGFLWRIMLSVSTADLSYGNDLSQNNCMFFHTVSVLTFRKTAHCI